MPEIGPKHPLSYRREVAGPLFELIGTRDSCAVVGPASMGKSRLVQFVMRLDVQQHYLGKQAAATLLVLADSNRLAEVSEWGLYELLLTALVEACGICPITLPLRAEFNDLRREAITSHDAVLARRHVELAVHMLCWEHGLTVGVLLDEFDEMYRTVPPLALANLRALRDANKYRLCYILMLREHPARLRPTAECEGFYELFSRGILGLAPYTAEDAGRVLEQLEARKGRALAQSARDLLIHLSGGHPGLLVALFDALIRHAGAIDQAWGERVSVEPTIREECRKLWGGLADDERLALNHIVHGIDADDDVRRVLVLKGLLQVRGAALSLFSALFERFVLAEGLPVQRSLWVDEATRVIWLGTHPIKNLTAREFDLLLFLYRHLGQVCTRDQLLAYLYPHDTNNADLEDSRMDTLIKRVREKIEPVRQHPRYLLTVRGAGYRLVAAPEAET